MIKNKIKLIIVTLLFSIFFSFFNVYFSYATTDIYPGEFTNVSAKVGQYYLNLSGFIAPYASVVLISNGNILRSVVADQTGYFYFTGVLIDKGFSNFCLDAVDVKRLGESYTCLTVNPATSSITQNNIFLPPTFGVERNQINVGSSAIVWGYSMPNAQVKVYLSDGRTVMVTADSTGFYQTTFKIDKTGSYEFFADAFYKNQKSLSPSRKASFLALSSTQQLQKGIANWFSSLINFILQNPWGVVLVILPILILIVILLKKLRPSWFTWFDQGEQRLFALVPFRKRKLHHAWFIGY